MKAIKRIENKAKNWDEFTDVLVIPQITEQSDIEQRVGLYDEFTKSKDKIGRTILHKKEMDWIYPLECLKNHFKIRKQNLSIVKEDLDKFYDMKLSEEGEGFKKLFTSVEAERYREGFMPESQTDKFIDKINRVKGKTKIKYK